MLIETKNVLQIMSINWYFINFIFSLLKIFQKLGLKFSKWNMVKNTFSLNLFIPPIFWNLSKEKNGAIFLIIKDHLHPTEIIIWVAPRSNLMLFSEDDAALQRCSPASHDDDDEAGEKGRLFQLWKVAWIRQKCLRFRYQASTNKLKRVFNL